MMDFNEAFEIIGGHDSEFDYCTEYANAFVFSKKDELSFGGINSPVAVMKEDGCCISFVAYISESDHRVVRDGYLKNWTVGSKA